MLKLFVGFAIIFVSGNQLQVNCAVFRAGRLFFWEKTMYTVFLVDDYGEEKVHGVLEGTLYPQQVRIAIQNIANDRDCHVKARRIDSVGKEEVFEAKPHTAMIGGGNE